MTKFEPAEAWSRVYLVNVKEIENGFIVERVGDTNGIIHCETAAEMAAIVESAFTQKN